MTVHIASPLALVLIALGLLSASPAAARYEPQPAGVFSSPSRAVYCSLLWDAKRGTNGVSCVVPSTGTRAWTSYELHWHGRSRRIVSDDFPDMGAVPRIPYGATWAMVGPYPKRHSIARSVNCTSRRSGLTCTNASRHGFSLSREAQRVF